MENVKKGNLNYDQSGKAYPDKPHIKKNWDCIWEHNGKYYKLVGDDEHKEWEEVDIYNHIIDEVYGKYLDYLQENEIHGLWYDIKNFINECKTDSKFSEKWGLKIDERVLSTIERMEYYGKHYMKEHESMSFDNLTKIDYDKLNIPTKLFTITYNGETIESYE